MANPFFSALLRGIEDVARSRDWLVLSGSSDGERSRRDHLVEAFAARRVDGLIVVSSDLRPGPLRTELDRGTRRRGDRRCSPPGFAKRASVRRWPAPDWPSASDASSRGPTMPRSGGRSSPSTSPGADGRRRLHRAELHHHRPAHALHEHGLQHTIAHIGFDDIELADIVEPGISVVPQHPRELGRRAAERLFARIEGLTGPPIQEVFGAAVVERGSGEIRPPRAGKR